MVQNFKLFALVVLFLLVSGTASAQAQGPYLVVLGVAQDGGIPQTGTKSHPAWTNPGLRRAATSLGLVDPESSERWIFEATPDLKNQLHRFDEVFPVTGSPGLAGIFLTHAHIGHYTGLMLLGHESLGARDVPVFAMPRMRSFLEQNGPWDQLVRYGNIQIRALEDGKAESISSNLKVTPFRVPHRQEYSEVVGFRISGPQRTALFIPDIDSWEEWAEAGHSLEDVIRGVDIAYLDATFYADGEVRGRDMSGFPHPRITHTMKLLSHLPSEQRGKIRFIHLNHTNPAVLADRPARRAILEAGFRVAEEGEIVHL